MIVLQAWILSRIIAGFHVGGWTVSTAEKWLGYFLVVIFGRFFLVWLGESSAGRIAVGIKNHLRKEIITKIERLGPVFLAREQSGELTTLMIQGLDALDGYFSQFLPQVILAAAIPVCVLIGVFPRDWLSGVILLLTAPLLPLFMILIGGAAEKTTRKQWYLLGKLSGQFLDILQGLATLKAFNQTQTAAKKVRDVSDQYRIVTLQVMRLTFLSSLALELVSTISIALVAVQIGLRLLNNGMNFEQALFILVVAPDFYLPLRQLGLRFHSAASGISASRRIFTFLNKSESTSQEKTSHRRSWIWDGPPEILLESVSARYPDKEDEAISNVDLLLPAGKTTAVIGRSGSGKTTLSYLLLGFLSPSTGKICVDGLNLATLDLRDWRSGIAWVGQNPVIFYGTLAENLRQGNLQITDRQLWDGLETCGLAAWISSLPEGLSTRVGDRGLTLSSGQRQRLAMCRAILKDPRLVILDEPTAHLDVLNEDNLVEAMKTLMKERTVLLIAHRMPTLKFADQLVILESGRVVEVGPPQKVIATSIHLQKMVRFYSHGNSL